MRSLVPVEIKKFHADTLPCYRKGERKDNQKQIDQRPSTFVVRRRPEERKKTLDGPSCPALARLVPAARDESKKLSDILDGNEEETGRRATYEIAGRDLFFTALCVSIDVGK